MHRPTRRQFLTAAGAALGTAVAGGLVFAADRDLRSSGPTTTPPPTAGGTDPPPTTTAPSSTSTTSTTAAPAGATTDHVLVVVQLGGGNDGLNTLVPLDGRYHDARRTIGVADDSLVTVPGTTAYGLHPALAPWRALLDGGQVAALDGIGYPDPSRSHFAALDDWWSATPGSASTTGWIGRWLDTLGPDVDPLTAVALGAGAPALLGARTRPTVVLSPAAFRVRPPKGSRLALDARSGGGADVVDRYRAAVHDAGVAAHTFATLSSSAPDEPTTEDGGDGDIARNLATAARLIAHEPATRVVQVAVGGFDTHADQQATQQRLLGDLATGVSSFFTALARDGHDRRVLLVTVSEFGRRVAENGSGGTDHGKASVQFAIGPSVRGGVYGGADLARLDDGDVAPQLDVRSLYAVALSWLGGEVDGVLWDPLESTCRHASLSIL